MAAKSGINTDATMPIVSKMFCSPSETVLVVRRRPNVMNGGGFVVTDCGERVIFRVDGCGILGKKGEVMLKDEDGNALLLIRKKGAIVEALSITRQWKGFNYDYMGSKKPVFTLKEPNSCFLNTIPIKISLESKESSNYGNFEIMGDFPERSCSIVSSKGDVIAEIGVRKEVMTSKDLYHVDIKPGIDQAFVFGVIAVLDYIYDGSTRC